MPTIEEYVESQTAEPVTITSYDTGIGRVEVRADGLLGLAAQIRSLDFTEPSPEAIAGILASTAQFMPPGIGVIVGPLAGLVTSLFGSGGVDIGSLRHNAIMDGLEAVGAAITALSVQLTGAVDTLKLAMASQTQDIVDYMMQLSGEQQAAYGFIVEKAKILAVETDAQLDAIALKARADIGAQYDGAIAYADTKLIDTVAKVTATYQAQKTALLGILSAPLQQIAGVLTAEAERVQGRLEYLKQLELFIITANTFDTAQTVADVRALITK